MRISGIVLLSLSSLLGGCVGVVVEGPHENVLANNPYGALKLESRPQVSLQADAIKLPPVTSEQVAMSWGPPDSKTRDGSRESWTYQLPDLRWTGLILAAVVLPVPLLLPLGHEYTELKFDGGVLESVVVHGHDFNAYLLCSPLPNPFQDIDRHSGGFQYPCVFG